MASSLVPTPTTATVDRYLETIYCIAGEGETVRPGRLAVWLGVSAPTVSNALQRLARDGWIDVAPDRSVTLTSDGQAAAAALVRRHRVLERWLVDVLALDWATADVEAEVLASAFSDVVIDRLDQSMGTPPERARTATPSPAASPPTGRSSRSPPCPRVARRSCAGSPRSQSTRRARCSPSSPRTA